MNLSKAATITMLLAIGANALAGADETLHSRQDENHTQIAQIHAYNYTNCNPFDYDGFAWVYESQIPDDDCIVLSEFLDSNETVISLATLEVAAGCNVIVYADETCSTQGISLGSLHCGNAADGWRSISVPCE